MSIPNLSNSFTFQLKFLGHEIKINVPNEDADLITSSGDQTCVLRDVTTGQRVSVFGGQFPSGHTADVLSVSINASDPSIFDSGSCVTTARLWDSRKGSRAVRTYHGHKGDVNTVKFFPDGQRFGTGSDDGTCRLFDVRTGHELQVNHQQHNDDSRLLFVGYSNGDCYVWDTIMAKVLVTKSGGMLALPLIFLVSGGSADGSALCTGSWDRDLKIWAFGGHRG
ncbi:hypothetical protein MKW94_007012 [Papaver nudicaule]|uniref:Uncharacterized protein n=1 Tax=Papaver nudicaule TaxID=74823 RepID=A0AA41RW52_PAPNU|nr:hypothetical protein [Papaver nudicaule]